MGDLNEIKLEDEGKQINEEQYEAFLKEYNLNLPKAYKEFILFNNGGIVM